MRLFRNVAMDAFGPGIQQIATGLESVVPWRFSHAPNLHAALAAGRIENVATKGNQHERDVAGVGLLERFKQIHIRRFCR